MKLGTKGKIVNARSKIKLIREGKIVNAKSKLALFNFILFLLEYGKIRYSKKKKKGGQKRVSRLVLSGNGNSGKTNCIIAKLFFVRISKQRRLGPQNDVFLFSMAFS